MKEYRSLSVLRPICFFTFLALAVLLCTSLFIPCWYAMIKHVERHIASSSNYFRSELQFEIAETSKFLHPLNSSATNLARVLGSSLNGTQLSFSQFETLVAPVLFQALSTIPYLSQISYIGQEGQFFSYYTEGNQTLAVYSNSSSFFNQSDPKASKNYTFYIQSVNSDTGILYGEAVESPSWSMINTSWSQEVLSSTQGYASVEAGWNNARDLLFLSSARVNGGVISLGFPVKALTTILTPTDRQGSSIYLATQNGKVLIEGLQNTHMILADDVVSFQLMHPNGDQMGRVGNVSCNLKDGAPAASTLNIQEKEYTFYCLPLDIVGVQSVFVMAFPQDGLVSLVHRNKKVALPLLTVTIASVVVSLLSMVFIIIKDARREMYLCAALIKQMEATQQAERKSMNKSLAFASASHDVRASLAGLTGLIEICYDEVAPCSELETNLRQMDTCAKDLLGILNSILDTSKIEAGKMQLEEEEFDLAQLLEDVVDLYHPLGIKKGVDVVLDPYDGSAIKFPQVRGDRGKLKQILCNLVSNAVKFTSEGHVTIRAWVRKANLHNSISASKQNCLSCFFYKNSQAYNDLEALNRADQDPNVMEFVFEVDDTGKGIPKEKHTSIFENFVQVKEIALGQGGTGLGLGIVQSLVRLMHGDIEIVDKEIGQKGTCFRFNVLFTLCENASHDTAIAEDLDLEAGTNQFMGPTNCTLTQDPSVNTPNPASGIQTSSPKLAIHSPIPKLKASHVVLLIQNDERRRTSLRFMKSLYIKVSVAKQWEDLPFTLQKIKQNINHSDHSSRGKSYLSSPNDSMNTSASSHSIAEMDAPSSSIDGPNYIVSVFKRTNPRSTSGLILIVIDVGAGPFPELCKAVAEFKRGLQNTYYQVVWLEKQTMRSISFKGIEEDIDPNDGIISKPFHGSRLYDVIRILPEFGGTMQGNIRKPKRESMLKSRKMPREKVLSGKKILVAEDNLVLRKLTISNLLVLGANVEYSENGQEVLQLVRNCLSEQRKHAASKILPYDYILMDCEMPIMDGYEATKKIREMEKDYHVRIPIIALTSHDASSAEAKRTIEAGMDVHLVKPLKREHLLEAIRYIDEKRKYV